MSGALLLGAPMRRWRLPLPLALLLLTAAADALLWAPDPGLGLGLAALGAGALMLARSWPAGRDILLLGALLALSAVQSAIEVTDANLLVLAVLLALLLGATAYPALAGPCARMAAVLRAGLASAFRWWRLWRVARRGHWAGAWRLLRLVLPAALLALPFALLLGLGNAVMGEWLTHGTERLARTLGVFDVTPARILFWMVMATLALLLLRPKPQRRDAFAALEAELPVWRRADPILARRQGAVMLLALNALFLMANTADALHLWAHQALPPGVSYAAFVHRGTEALILATLLSGAVITAIFQQQAEVTRSVPLRALALGWIAQNVLLIASVALRLWLYVEAYQLSVLRVGLGLFLLLVAGGFGLLAWQVLRGIGLRRLVLANAALAFGIGFAVQFVDIPGLVARTNVGLWRGSLDAGRPHPLDLEHLVALGPAAWPALMAVAEEARAPASLRFAAQWHLARAAWLLRVAPPARSWQSVQLRRDRLRKRVLAFVPREGE